MSTTVLQRIPMYTEFIKEQNNKQINKRKLKGDKIMNTKMMNKVELNNEMLEQVNGGYSWEEFKEDFKKAREIGELLEITVDSIPVFW